MIIYVNGTPQETSEQVLGGVLKEIPGVPETFAVAVNGKIVPRSKHQEFVINAGDKIEIFALMAGG